MRLSFLTTLLASSASVLCVAQEDESALSVGVKGFVDSYHALRIESPNDWMASRTRARGELSLSKGSAGTFVSANLIYNAVLRQKSGFQLREAYAFYNSSHWDVRVGRQIVTWGVADGLRLTDLISPMDYTEFLAQDYDDIRIPVGCLRLRHSRDSWSAELVAVPVNSMFELPFDNDNPWSVKLDVPGLTCFLHTGPEPASRLRNMEFGGRLAFFLSGIDFSACALRTWNKMPVFRKQIVDGVLDVEGVYERMTMLGADVSLPIGQCVLRAEVAEYLDEAQDAEIATSVQSSPSTNALVAIDWYAANDWSLSAQYCHKYIGNVKDGMDVYENSGLATLRVSKELLNNTLSLSSFAYADVTDGGIFNRLSADYAISDQLHVTLGYDFFYADGGMFAMYKDNSELWAKLKFSF